ncbi:MULTISPECIES: cytochrome P450 [Streptomyces]|uniref:cytochrome P450 n=1 Tax=Streptomyces TaxID=1883 RepID=UPI001E54EE96|nr:MULTISPECIES: cytochrome P450 [Streptomyces]UFQ18718.1 cytochrome P450 [Streptomyces huasconensis]WCL88335.1 cytochrome P450 [Streptomyces sp. JCM 35825]
MNSDELPLRFPFSRRGDEVPVECDWLRRNRPVARVITLAGDEAWLVASHELCHQVLTDPRFSLYATADDGVPQQYARAFPPDAVSNMANITSAGLRDEVMKSLSPRKNEELTHFLRATAEALIDKAVAGGSPVDLWAGYASPLSMRLMTEILGLRDADETALAARCDVAMGTSAHTPAEAARNWEELRAVMATALRPDRRRAAGLLPRLAALREDRPEDELTVTQLCDVGCNMLVAGYESLAAFLGHAIMLLAGDQEQTTRLRETPALMPRAIEELYRRNLSIGDGLPRLATEDVRLGDTDVAAGSLVLVCVEGANHDPEVFPEPTRLDIDRAANPHLTFGGGAHYCPATSLSRLHAHIGLETLLARLPKLVLAIPASELTWSWGMIKRLPKALPVRL